MTATVAVPFWLIVVLAVGAAIALADRLVLPGARWLVRRRLDRVVDELNVRLKLRLEPFKLTKREVLIDRLVYDPQVMEAAEAEAQARGEPRAVTMARVTHYAREIVPSFNAYVYFRVGYALARWVARALYRVRLGYADMPALERLGADASVVFVMNHRSNMDYVLVAYLAAERTALSYAVGEWARIWPLQNLIRAMGAYFIRRNSGDPLYRRVLERYVYMATEAGVTQAIYPEGGLSRDGALRGPKLGLFDYLVRAFDPQGQRDIVFVPVGINYDRVLEDRSLLRGADATAAPRGALDALRTTLGFIAGQAALMLRGHWFRFGYACVNFGAPLSLRGWLAAHGEADLRRLDKDARFQRVDALARDLMAAVGRVVPVLPVSLVASIFVRDSGRAWSEPELKAEAARLMGVLEAAGAHVYVPRTDRDYAISVGLRMLTLRRLVLARDGQYAAAPAELPLLRYYANAIQQLLPPAAAAHPGMKRAGAKASDLVVLAHGLSRTSRSLRHLEMALRQAGYETLNWGYPSRAHDIAGLAARFAALIASLAGRPGKVHFVGHSLGAILIRFGVQGRLGFDLGRIVMLAPPNRGATVVSRLRLVPLLPRVFGRPTVELDRDAPWLMRGAAPAADIGVIAGTRTWHPLSPGSWFNRVLALPRPHDGTVELESTALPGMRDFISVHAIHGRIASHPEVIRQTLHFLAHGIFERGGAGSRQPSS